MPKVSISGPPKTIIMPMREHPRSEVERSRIHEVSMARVSPKDIFFTTCHFEFPSSSSL